MANNPLTLCPLEYRGTACGYQGALPTCSKTFYDCVSHANTVHFGGMSESQAEAVSQATSEIFPNGIPLDDREKRERGLLPPPHPQTVLRWQVVLQGLRLRPAEVRPLYQQAIRK